MGICTHNQPNGSHAFNAIVTAVANKVVINVQVLHSNEPRLT